MIGQKEKIDGDWIWILAFALWGLVLVWKWPVAVSFGDEVGYVGQMRVLLEGRFRPMPQDPGIWIPSGHGLVARYPYFVPILAAPLFAIHPRLIFLVGPLAALALVFLTARVLRAWGYSSGWASLILMHPTVIIMARTVMTDLVLAALVVGTWWTARHQRLGWTALLAAAATLSKATGFVIVAGLAAGEMLRAHRELRRRDRAAVRRIAFLAGGLAAGLIGTIALNFVATGRLWFEYDRAHEYLGTPQFWPSYFLTSAPVHLRSLLLVPPLLVAGVWPFWRRREFGPLVAGGGLVVMMCFYFFVDRGRSIVETLLLSPRLILPALAFLLIGYAALIADLWERLTSHRYVPALLAALPALIAVPISLRHRAWQDPDARALATAAAVAGDDGVLGLTITSTKSGMLYAGRAVQIETGARPAVILCGRRYPSYRTVGDVGEFYNCDLPGYEKLETDGNNSVLRRKGP
jgi:hypothetical protein